MDQSKIPDIVKATFKEVLKPQPNNLVDVGVKGSKFIPLTPDICPWVYILGDMMYEIFEPKIHNDPYYTPKGRWEIINSYGLTSTYKGDKLKKALNIVKDINKVKKVYVVKRLFFSNFDGTQASDEQIVKGKRFLVSIKYILVDPKNNPIESDLYNAYIENSAASLLGKEKIKPFKDLWDNL